MNTKGMDNARYVQTEESIREAFWELIRQKPWQSISIREIVERARINRVTFYYHYKDLYDLVDRVETELMQTVFRPLHHITREDYVIGQHPLTTAFFRAFRENQKKFYLLLGSNGDAGFHSRMIDELVSVFEDHWKKVFVQDGMEEKISDAYFAYLAGGLVSMMIRNGTRLSSDELGVVAGKMIVSMNEIALGQEK